MLRMGVNKLLSAPRTRASVWLVLLSLVVCAGLPLHPNRLRAQKGQDLGDLSYGSDQVDPVLADIEREIAGGKYDAAKAPMETYVKDHPDSARAHYDLGYVLFRIHKIGDSIGEMAKSLKLNPDNGEAHKILGMDFTIIGRYDVAESELQWAERLEPDSREIHYQLGRTYYTRGVYARARQEFETVLRMDPVNMKAYNNLGLVMEVLGDDAMAVKDYTTAARLDDEQGLHSEWPYVNLSAYYNRQYESDEALVYAQKALTVNPRSDLAYFQIAKANRTKGEWQKAVDAAMSAIAIESRQAEYYYVLGVALRKLGREKESKEALASFEKLQEQEATLTMGRIRARDASAPDMH